MCCVIESVVSPCIHTTRLGERRGDAGCARLLPGEKATGGQRERERERGATTTRAGGGGGARGIEGGVEGGAGACRVQARGAVAAEAGAEAAGVAARTPMHSTAHIALIMRHPRATISPANVMYAMIF